MNQPQQQPATAPLELFNQGSFVSVRLDGFIFLRLQTDDSAFWYKHTSDNWEVLPREEWERLEAALWAAHEAEKKAQAEEQKSILLNGGGQLQ